MFFKKKKQRSRGGKSKDILRLFYRQVDGVALYSMYIVLCIGNGCNKDSKTNSQSMIPA